MTPFVHFAGFVALSVLSTQSLRNASPAQLAALPAVEHVVFAVFVNLASAFRGTGRWKRIPSEQEPPTASANGVAGTSPGGTAIQFRRTAWLAGAAAAAATALRPARFIRDPATLSQTLEVSALPDSSILSSLKTDLSSIFKDLCRAGFTRLFRSTPFAIMDGRSSPKRLVASDAPSRRPHFPPRLSARRHSCRSSFGRAVAPPGHTGRREPALAQRRFLRFRRHAFRAARHYGASSPAS